MKSRVFKAGVIGFIILMGSVNGYAEEWVKINVDVPNQNLEANYYDGDSVKVVNKTLTWTEKFVLTSLGEKSYTKHLSQYPACRSNIEKRGDVTFHTIVFEIKGGKFRTVAKRNYNKANELICTDQDMGNELDKSWHEIVYETPMYRRHYILATKYKIGDL